MQKWQTFPYQDPGIVLNVLPLAHILFIKLCKVDIIIIPILTDKMFR